MEMKHYAELQHFYQSGGFFYDTIILEIDERCENVLPLSDVYAFRYFDSHVDITNKEISKDKIFEGIINPSKWYYIGTCQSMLEYKNNEGSRHWLYKNMVVEWEKKGNDTVLFADLPGMPPIGFKSSEAEEIFDPGIREKSPVKLRDGKKPQRWI